MSRMKKSGISVGVKSRKPRTTDPDARIAMVEKQIERLETLNASRRELIAKTEEKLNQRKEALHKSEDMLENARAKRERIVHFKERRAMSKEERAAQRAEEKAKINKLLEALRATGIGVDEMIEKLSAKESAAEEDI